ncbi:uncharacterized protein LOC123446588 [Hordeum vulgare subsp. vulgare]|uniref:Uncharacterized protein n=1 Tax=Hordeum vulgare subsp. vulgare TaxID=112509 RepID=A0A8I6XCX2_HORVV|nr:uncharacterized protein LOC123446588 [Hordeum vulgare subsp. vulgare]
MLLEEKSLKKTKKKVQFSNAVARNRRVEAKRRPKMCPRRRDHARKGLNSMEARVAKVTSATSFSKPPPLALPKTAQFFLRHLPNRSRGGASVVPHVEWERKTDLRDSIHDAYLRALARLPFNAPHGVPTVPALLPALLAGGYCFGPLSDGASNVIVNTVWLFAASSPARFAAVDTVVDVVDINDIEHGSFLGLNRVVHDVGRNYDYYHAAAVAAKHPNCEAFAAFAQSGVATSPAVTELLAGGSSANLSAEDIERLAVLLVRPSTPPLDSCLVLESKFTAEREEYMRARQEWKRKLANMAIQHWNRTIGGPELQLHVVCDASAVCHNYQHINFMATSSDNPAAIQLFFAEYEKQMGVVLCCPVQDSVSLSGHCDLCEGLDERLIHPAFGAYNFRSPLDATSGIIDFDVANLLDIKYARHLWGSRHMGRAFYPSDDFYSSADWKCDFMVFR